MTPCSSIAAIHVAAAVAAGNQRDWLYLRARAVISKPWLPSVAELMKAASTKVRTSARLLVVPNDLQAL